MVSPELSFLLDGIRGMGGDESIVPTLNEVVDESRLIELATSHGLAAYAANWVPSTSLARVHLQRVAALAHVRSMASSAALVEIVEALKRADIPSITFKGPATALRLYDSLAQRPFLDLDILLPHDRLFEGHQTLLQIGFEPDPHLGEFQLACSRGKHLSHIRDTVRVEIHSRLFSERKLGGRSEFSNYWHRRHSIEIAGQSIASLGLSDTVFHSAIHASGHAFVSLKWLIDQMKMISGGPEWEKAWESGFCLARQRGVEAAFLTGPALLADLGFRMPVVLGEALKGSAHRRSRLQARSLRLWDGDSFTPWDLMVHQRDMLPGSASVRAMVALLFESGPRDWQILPFVSPRRRFVFAVVRLVRLVARVGKTMFIRQVPK